MKTKITKCLSLAILLSLSITLSACGTKTTEKQDPAVKGSKKIAVEEVKESKPEPKAEEPKVEEEKKEEEVRSLLTGLPIDKALVGKRPFAYMFNNIKFAYPQTGSSKAGIIYEILAEGGITRLMGVFDEMKGDRIGSARSARHYYVDFAKEFDAFFIHFGQTKYAIAEMKKLNMDTLSGLSSEGSIVFYRDNQIKPPHNAFASAEGIYKAVEKKGYRTELKEGMEAHFAFSYDKEINLTEPTAFEATHVTIPFSGYMTPYFTYDKGKYTRFAFGSKHIDKGNNKALTFKNLIIQLVNEYNIDRNGYQTMDLIGFSGSAYYITNGKALPVYWKKEGADTKTKFYYDEKHTKEINVNIGKTYYAVFPINSKDRLKFKK